MRETSRPLIFPVMRGTREAYSLYAPGYLHFADNVTSVSREGLFDFLNDSKRENDRTTWRFVTEHLREVTKAVGRPLKLLDVGCGPGVWLSRLLLEFPDANGVGIDITDPFIAQAQDMARTLGIQNRACFEVQDGATFGDPDSTYDVVLCLHDVLNNDPEYLQILRNLHRLARNSVILSVHSIHAVTTCYVTSEKNVRSSIQRDSRLVIETQNGQSIQMYSHLFTAAEIADCVCRFGEIVSVRGIDLLGSRFAVTSGVPTPAPLDELEEAYREHPLLINYYKHILVVSHPCVKCGARVPGFTLTAAERAE